MRNCSQMLYRRLIISIGLCFIEIFAAVSCVWAMQSRDLKLEDLLKADRATLEAARVARGHASPGASDNIEVRALAEQSDLIRIRLDRRLKDEFPNLPRTQLDYYADQLDKGLRSAKSPTDARAIFARLDDLQTYVCVLLNKRTSEELFSREIAYRYSIFKVKQAQR